MKIKLSVLFALYLLILFSSCKKLTPAGFWLNYKSDFIKNRISDQGPWGGTRAINWIANNPGTFNNDEVLKFAAKNGWKLTGTLYITEAQLKSWVDLNKPIFHLPYQTLPRWIYVDMTVYKFKTGWVAVEPGNARSTEENGYVAINKNGTLMSVYHVWGE